jgi:hypothetical protein
MKVSQCLKILRIMLEHKEKKVWKASDFQSGEFFVGYEATARMSDLMRIYPDQFIVGKDGRFRTLELNWDNINEDFKKQVL